jgi:hypothetical protein
VGGAVTGPVDWLEQALKTAEDDARYSEDRSVFFDVSDDAAVDHYRGAGSPSTVLRLVTGARQILAEHANDGSGDCRACADPCEPRMALPWPCRTVRLLAEAWGWEEGESC